MNEITYKRFRQSLDNNYNRQRENDPLYYHRTVEQERTARPDVRQITLDPGKPLPPELGGFWNTHRALRYLVLYNRWAKGPWTINFEEV